MSLFANFNIYISSRPISIDSFFLLKVAYIFLPFCKSIMFSFLYFASHCEFYSIEFE